MPNKLVVCNVVDTKSITSNVIGDSSFGLIDFRLIIWQLIWHESIFLK